ncbi:hypothetical protein [Winogradskyella sp. A2]|uniref:hypothetical protein n=1 Tax=Winogradskyella sp. A2 TaxID=3366944 RepID=UPI00398C4718
MSRVKKFLTELDDYELANFAKFKLLTYMKETQSDIKEYLAERNLTETKIDQLISENPKSKLKDDKKRCPRCYSDKIRKDKVEWTDTAVKSGYSDEIASLDGLTGRATFVENEICNVCGIWISDPNNEKGKSIWRTIWNYLTDNPLGL